MADNKVVKVTLIKSLNSCQARHRLSAKALGLHKMHQAVVLKDSPQVRGLISQLYYLVQVEG
jgi:large subunit ribosomal protein L30